LILSPVELLYLMGTGTITLVRRTGTLNPDEFLTIAGETDQELAIKNAVYTELRTHGYTPRTGYKFGHHFRVYCGKNVHSDLLVHAVEKEAELQMSVISRSVRLAHSVKKKMFFGAVHSSGIQFVEFARIKL
jgi:tRNA-intron endonuclease